MVPDPDRRRHRRTKPFLGPQNLTIKYRAGTGPTVMGAKLLDFSDDGINVELASLLSAGLAVEIFGDIEGPAGPQPLCRRGLVRRCSAAGNGRYVAGLSFESAAEASTQEDAAKESEAPDYYEVLQLSRNA